MYCFQYAKRGRETVLPLDEIGSGIIAFTERQGYRVFLE